jgi:hypothetical protein
MIKLGVLALVVLAVTSCSSTKASQAVASLAVSSPSPGVSVASSPSPSMSPLPSPTPLLSSPTPVPLPSAAGLNVNCRLPVRWTVGDPPNTIYHAGFLQFPSEKLAEDPSASAGFGFIFYDRAFAKWLPTLRDYVSPDGGHYAYTEGNPLIENTFGKLHVVDVATGADRIIYTTNTPLGVVLYAADGIYFTHDSGDGFRNGLWLESPAGGQPRLVSTRIFQPSVSSGAAWGMYFNPADTNPGPSGIMGPYNTILRFDLDTGASTTWWYKPGADLGVVDGDYSGNLFVAVRMNDRPDALWVLSSSGAATVVYVGPSAPSYLAAVDTNGVWFDGGSTTIWLYAGGSMKRIADVPASDLLIAGGCIPGA